MTQTPHPSLPCARPDDESIANDPQQSLTAITNTKYYLCDWLSDQHLLGVAAQVHDDLLHREL